LLVADAPWLFVTVAGQHAARGHGRMAHVGGVLVFAATGLLPALAAADEVFATAQSDTGQFSTTVYGWLPDTTVR
jgi:hypothetical protein